MKPTSITPVLLCGGSGTRLWPLSRKSYPKQFVPLVGETTLFQASAQRLSGGTGKLAFDKPIVVTNSDFRFIVTEQLAGVGIDPGAILIEPEGRNTAPAVLAAALQIARTDPEGVMLVAPSDHVVPDVAAFHASVEAGLAAISQGELVTFGITPTRPETGYGYLELSEKPDGSGSPVKLSKFIEKPDEKRAEELVAAGTYLWNAGIFLLRVSDIISAFEAHAAGLVSAIRHADGGAFLDRNNQNATISRYTNIIKIACAEKRPRSTTYRILIDQIAHTERHGGEHGAGRHPLQTIDTNIFDLKHFCSNRDSQKKKAQQ